MPHAGNNFRAVGFDLHPAAASKPLLPSPKFVINAVDGDRNTRRKPSQRCYKTLAMGLPRGFEP
jgi:hypothetical protein